MELKEVRNKFLRAFLQLESYAQEVPRCIFKTNDPYKLIFRYHDVSRSDIPVGLFHGHILFFPAPGRVDTLQFEDIVLSYPDFKGPILPELASPDTQTYWTMIVNVGEEAFKLETTNLIIRRVREQPSTIEFRVTGEQGAGEPWTFGGSMYEEEGKERTLIDRAYGVFGRFEEYRTQATYISRFLKQGYDLERWVRR